MSDPASGLPQEAVDAAAWERHVRQRFRGEELTYCDKDGQRWPCEVARLLDALAAERAKGAGLREATIRECIDKAEQYAIYADGDNILAALRALLPAVSEGAPTVGTDGTYGTVVCDDYQPAQRDRTAIALGAKECRNCGFHQDAHATVVQPTGTGGECGHTEHRDQDNSFRVGLIERRHGLSRWEPCPGECGHVVHEHRDGVRFGYYGPRRATYAPEPCPSQSAKEEQ